MALRITRRFGALIAGGAVALSAAMPALEAQTLAARRNASPTTSEDSITVTGCLLLGPYGDYTLSKTIVTSGSVLNAVAWKLEGRRDLLGHILEKVEITGIMTPVRSMTLRSAGGDGAASRDEAVSYRLRVNTIKKIVGGCA